MERLHANTSLQEHETDFNYLVISSSLAQCSTALLVFHLLLSSWPLTGPSRSHHGLSSDQQHVLLALRCYKKVLFGRWRVFAVRLLELFQRSRPLGFLRSIVQWFKLVHKNKNSLLKQRCSSCLQALWQLALCLPHGLLQILPLWWADSQLFALPPTFPLISTTISPLLSSCLFMSVHLPHLQPPPPFDTVFSNVS